MKTKKTLNKALYNCMVKDFTIREYKEDSLHCSFKFYKLKDNVVGLLHMDKVFGNATIEWGQVMKSKHIEKLLKDFASAYIRTPETYRRYYIAMHLYHTITISEIKYSKQAIKMANETLSTETI